MSDLTEETAKRLITELSTNRAMLGEVASRHERLAPLIEAQVKLMAELFYIEDLLAQRFADYVSKRATVDTIIDGVGRILGRKIV